MTQHCRTISKQHKNIYNYQYLNILFNASSIKNAIENRSELNDDIHHLIFLT